MLWPFNRPQIAQKATLSEAHIAHTGRHEYGMRDWASYAEEGYAGNPTIYRCISMIAQNFAKVPLYVKNEKGDIMEDHPVADLLNQPNPDEGGVEFRTAGASWYLLTGNSFMELMKEGETAQLWHYQPYDMSVKGAGAMPALYTFLRGKSGERSWDVDPASGRSQLLHWRTFNPSKGSSRFGQAPLSAGAKSGDTYNAGTDWRFQALKNGGSIKGILSMPDADTGQIKNLRQKIKEAFTGTKNANSIASLNTKTEWQQLGMNMKDADWLQGSKLNAQEIASVFGVPTQMLGIEGSQTFANYEQARLSFWIDTVMPLLDLYVSELSRFLNPNYEGPDFTICYDDEDIEALEPQRKERRSELLATDVLTLNEKREVVGYEPRPEPDASQIFVDPNKIPLGLDVFSEDERQEEEMAKALMRAGVPREEAQQKAFDFMAERRSVRDQS